MKLKVLVDKRLSSTPKTITLTVDIRQPISITLLISGTEFFIILKKIIIIVFLKATKIIYFLYRYKTLKIKHDIVIVKIINDRKQNDL
jgi:hypothetical protein